MRNHISNIFTKLQVADRAQAIIRAREAGLGTATADAGDGWRRRHACFAGFQHAPASPRPSLSAVSLGVEGSPFRDGEGPRAPVGEAAGGALVFLDEEVAG